MSQKRRKKPLSRLRISNPWAALRKRQQASSAREADLPAGRNLLELESRVLYSAAPIGDLTQEPELAHMDVDAATDALWSPPEAADTWTDFYARDDSVSAQDFGLIPESSPR
ncbi:MAG: hypothetical protein ACR2NP_12565, partial [Pirellulaceae bacterium]